MHRIAAAAVVATFAVTTAFAQNAEPPVPGQENVAPRLDPKACRDRERLGRGDTIENEGRAPSEPEEPLGDKLARTDGVLCPPPSEDPDIHVPAPKEGSQMPVIPPPGSPGGDPAVRPK